MFNFIFFYCNLFFSICPFSGHRSKWFKKCSDGKKRIFCVCFILRTDVGFCSSLSNYQAYLLYSSLLVVYPELNHPFLWITNELLTTIQLMKIWRKNEAIIFFFSILNLGIICWKWNGRRLVHNRASQLRWNIVVIIELYVLNLLREWQARKKSAACNRYMAR